MGDELDEIIQRMIDAGESEENIATVIQDFEAQQPAAPVEDPGMRLIFGSGYDRQPAPIGDILGKQIPTALGQAALLGGAGKLLSMVPAGRLLTSGVAAAKAGIAKAPLIGPPLRAAVKAGGEAWKGSAPKPTPKPTGTGTGTPSSPIVQGGWSLPRSAAPKPAAPTTKPKWSAAEVAQKGRDAYGSEKAGRMLFGPAREGVKASQRTDAIKRLAPGPSQLPKAAQRAIDKELASSTASEAFDFAAKAPNDLAKEYFGDILRAALQQRMRR